ncbi:MAG: response regulator, partial [Pseudolabrys sp.]|nr:response regulator [Pseudolabrys sp.]
MSIAQTLTPHLPILRRYARALTGSQASGDAYVAATLEALVKEPGLLDAKAPTRVALFRVFSKIWNSVSLNASAEPAVALPA